MSSQSEVAAAGGDVPPATVPVWDPLVRMFHWSLAGLFGFAFLTGDAWDKAHEAAGYAIAGLIAARIVWGVVGSKHARFADFVYRPATVVAFLGDSLRLRARRYVGHNPAGGAMVIALLSAVAGTCLTGYMMITDAYWGVQWVEDAHVVLTYATLGLIGLHVAGVALASFEHRENLVRSMFTGRKRKH